jgi:hypothetical protein
MAWNNTPTEKSRIKGSVNVYTVQLLGTKRKLSMNSVFILMQVKGITVGVDINFLWKLGKIIGLPFF